MMINRDKNYFKRLNHFRNVVQSQLKKTGQSITKYKVGAMVSVLLDKSYKRKYDTSKHIHLESFRNRLFLENLHTVSRNVIVFRFNKTIKKTQRKCPESLSLFS